MKKYPAYKDSGVEWIGEIPKSWGFQSIRSLTADHRQGFYAGSNYDDTGYKLVRITDLDDYSNIDFSKCPHYDLPEKEVKEYILEVGDFVFPRTGSIGKFGVMRESLPALYLSYLIRFRFKEKVSTEFLIFFFQSKAYLNSLLLNLHGGVNQNIHAENIKDIKIPVPAIEEQTAIATYLDHKTTIIDQLLQHSEQMKALLKEQRTAIINQAVTKGLTHLPHTQYGTMGVPLKDSGVEWIGEVPEHWEVSRLDFIATINGRVGWKALKADEYVDEGYIFLATPNIKDRFINFENVNYITKERYEESPEIMLEEGDILLAKDGSTLGITNVVRSLPKPATVNSSIAVLKIYNTEVDSIFLYHFIKGHYTQNVIQLLKGGMGVPHLFQADIKKFVVLVPPKTEQTAITHYLDLKTNEIDTLIQKEEQRIGLLKEYRASLISEVVTGKICVV